MTKNDFSEDFSFDDTGQLFPEESELGFSQAEDFPIFKEQEFFYDSDEEGNYFDHAGIRKLAKIVGNLFKNYPTLNVGGLLGRVLTLQIWA